MERAMILLVSEQPMPNLLAALDSELAISEVHLVISAQMERNGGAKALATVLEARGLAVQSHSVADIFDPAETQRTVAGIIGSDPGRFIVNLTGGTKIMSLGAYLAASEANVRDILYVDHRDSRLHWLNGNRAPDACRAQLSVQEILAAHRFTDIGFASPQPDETELAQQLHALLPAGDPLAGWNRLFAAAREFYGKSRNRRKPHALAPLEILRGTGDADAGARLAALQEPLQAAAEAGLCEIAGGSITLPNAHARDFLGGVWFEHVVFAALRRQAARLALDEVVLGAEVRTVDDVPNEFDVVARRRDRLFIFEVKTGRLRGTDTPSADEVFYKLDSLRPKFGLAARACLVSRQAIKPDAAVRQRFAERRLGLIDGDAAAADTLGDRLAEWINAA